jgi:hypothetical protein
MRDSRHRKTASENTCSICNGQSFGTGNNAEPINHGRCCDTCNELVILIRMERAARGLPMREVMGSEKLQ